MNTFHDKSGPFVWNGKSYAILSDTANHKLVACKLTIGANTFTKTWAPLDADNGPVMLQNTCAPGESSGYSDAESPVCDQLQNLIAVAYIAEDKHITLACFDCALEQWVALDNPTGPDMSDFFPDTHEPPTANRYWNMVLAPSGKVVITYPIWGMSEDDPPVQSAFNRGVYWELGVWSTPTFVPTTSGKYGLVVGPDDIAHPFADAAESTELPIHAWWVLATGEWGGEAMYPGSPPIEHLGRPIVRNGEIRIPFIMAELDGSHSIKIFRRPALGKWGPGVWTIETVYSSPTVKVAAQLAGGGVQGVLFEYSAAGASGLTAVRDTPYFDWDRPVHHYHSEHIPQVNGSWVPFPNLTGTLVMWWILASAAEPVEGETTLIAANLPAGANYNALFYSIYDPGTQTWGTPKYAGGPGGIPDIDEDLDRRCPRLSVRLN